MALSRHQKERYARHFALKELGEEGQEKLLKSKVLIIGAGDLLTGRLLTYHALTMEFHEVKLPEADENCPACGLDFGGICLS